MMQIFIVGLGLMGASYAEALKQRGHTVFAIDHNHDVESQAITDGIVDGIGFEHLHDAELIILALYPKDNVQFVKTHHTSFKSGALLTDISGTKQSMIKDIDHILPRDIFYVSHHPMAGRAKVGYAHRDPNMFLGNRCILVTTERSSSHAIDTLHQLVSSLGFERIITVDAKHHDEMIAFTSQLTHVLAVALMHLKSVDDVKDATGDSFRDLTRIARINEIMWSELFIDNKSALSDVIERMIDELHNIKKLIETADDEGLRSYLKSAKEKRYQYD